MKLFISYSHNDETYKEQLDTHLAILKRNKVITTWFDRKIVGGQDWKDEIDDNLDSSKIVLFLISPDFLASESEVSPQKSDQKQSLRYNKIKVDMHGVF